MRPWVFFDVGNVLYVDIAQSYHAYRLHYQAMLAVRPALTFAELLSERERRIAAGRSWVLFEIARDWLGEEQAAAVNSDVRRWLIERFDDHHRPAAALPTLLPTLAARYRLGIIANQPAECRASLARRDLLRWFEVIALSEEIALYKPDPALFRWAIERCGVDPAHTVMVGDRIDNDVAPARQAGMRTVWLDVPPIAAGSSAQLQAGLPMDEPAAAFLASIDRQPLFTGRILPAPDGDHAPDQTIRDLAHLPTALAQLTQP